MVTTLLKSQEAMPLSPLSHDGDCQGMIAIVEY